MCLQSYAHARRSHHRFEAGDDSHFGNGENEGRGTLARTIFFKDDGARVQERANLCRGQRLIASTEICEIGSIYNAFGQLPTTVSVLRFVSEDPD